VISVLLTDDQAMVRSGLRALLNAEEDMQVVAEAGDGAQALELARRYRPDVIVMDIRMPVPDGVEATRQIAADPDLEGTRVLVLTTYDDELVFRALRAGGFEMADEVEEHSTDMLQLVAKASADLEVFLQRVAQPGHAVPPGHGCANSLSCRRSTLA
jgi:DNA-binding NarL/FixJ family response regulator